MMTRRCFSERILVRVVAYCGCGPFFPCDAYSSVVKWCRRGKDVGEVWDEVV